MQNRSQSVINVAFLPATVAGHPIALSESVANLGYKVRLFQLECNAFGYGINNAIFLEHDRFLLREIRRIKTLFQVLIWSNAIHCTAGSTLAGNSSYSVTSRKFTVSLLKERLIRRYEDLFFLVELNLYRLTRKRLVIDFQGDDIRQRDYQIQNYEHSIAHVVDENYYTPESDLRKKKRCELYKRYGFRMYALNPDLLNYLPKQATFMPYSNVKLDPASSEKGLTRENVFVFVHAPSNRTVKGTEKIIEVINQLKSEGAPVELKLVEGLKNDEALQLYRQAFMAIDQLNAGWYGGFAVECMAQGVPVISYLRDEDLKYLPNKMKEELPIKSTCSCDLKADIIELIRISKFQYEKLSQDGINFVNKWHNPDTIAIQVVKNYINTLN
jgi:glycosyltransferase involved in cell wall biosynthesis